MSEFYQVVPIDGKGLGCVATKDIKKGTLILREKAQILYADSALGKKDWIKNVVKSFNEMNQTNQEEFLKLHHHFFEQDLSTNQHVTVCQSLLRLEVSRMYESKQEQEKILPILFICYSNGFKNSDNVHCIPIQASRFNHSCSPNAVVRITSGGELFVRTITKIKTGEEINLCIGADHCIIKNMQARQKLLKEGYNFICACNYCKDGKEDIAIESFEAFEKFSEDAKRLHARSTYLWFNDAQTNPDPKYTREIIPFVKKEIQCYKDMYNLGKKKKSAVPLLYNGVYLIWKIINYHFHFTIWDHLKKHGFTLS